MTRTSPCVRGSAPQPHRQGCCSTGGRGSPPNCTTVHTTYDECQKLDRMLNTYSGLGARLQHIEILGGKPARHLSHLTAAVLRLPNLEVLNLGQDWGYASPTEAVFPVAALPPKLMSLSISPASEDFPHCLTVLSGLQLTILAFDMTFLPSSELLQLLTTAIPSLSELRYLEAIVPSMLDSRVVLDDYSVCRLSREQSATTQGYTRSGSRGCHTSCS